MSADADPAMLGQPLQSRRDVYPIPENVLLLSNHIAEVERRGSSLPLCLRLP
jgi:hypothetical protein